MDERKKLYFIVFLCFKLHSDTISIIPFDFFYYIAMKEGLLGLPGKLNPLFLSHELGFDLKLEGGQNHPAGKNRSVIWSAIFDNVNDYEAYDTSDEHISVVQNFIKPIIVPGSRSAIQYDIDE